MTIEQVIQLGEEIRVHQSIFELDRYWIAWAIVAFLVIIQIAFFLKKKKPHEERSLTPITLIFFLIFGLSMVNSITKDQRKEELIETWKQEVAYPYINSLPEEQHEIVYIKIDSELSHEVQGNLFYTYSEEVHRTPLTFSFKGNGIETHTNWIEAHMELTDQSKPYISFKRLTTSLGNGIESGYYNMKLHLPENYEFKDIK